MSCQASDIYGFIKSGASRTQERLSTSRLVGCVRRSFCSARKSETVSGLASRSHRLVKRLVPQRRGFHAGASITTNKSTYVHPFKQLIMASMTGSVLGDWFGEALVNTYFKDKDSLTPRERQWLDLINFDELPPQTRKLIKIIGGGLTPTFRRKASSPSPQKQIST